MPPLEDFMDSLTQRQDTLVQMGIITSTNDQSLFLGVSNKQKGKNKSKDSKQQRVKCWNIVTWKNILYVSFVVPKGPTGRTTCINFYPDAYNQKN